MFFTFLSGVLVGIALVVFVLWVYIYDPWGPVVDAEPFIDQFRPIQIPEELRNFLKTGKDGLGISEWESCHSLSLFLHMFYQEHKDTRQLRRWMHKRLQMELNDIATRSAAGRFLHEIRIRDLSLGTKFPCLSGMRVEKVEMSEDKTTFESITFLLNVDYTGGFETSVDVSTALAKANLSIKITKLAGLVRLILSRRPYNHWTMSFVSMPEFETDVSSAVSGHQLKRLIPLIKESIKRALQRKHVWPNYKIRYRPVFPNPLLQPSPPLSAFAHVKLTGGLEITVLKCTRLKVDLLGNDGNWDVYCTLGMDQRPFLQNNSQNVAHSLSVMLVFSRYDLAAPIGLTFEKPNATATPAVGHRPVRVASVAPGSLADKAMLKPGDTFVAINNVPIRSERQVARFLEQTLGDLMVLVDRNLDDMDEDEMRESEEIIGDPNGDPDDAFVALGCVKPPSSAGLSSPIIPDPSGSSEASSLRDGQRRHSLSAEPSTSSAFGTTESITSSMHSLNVEDICTTSPHLVQRAESARVPHLLVSQPSLDLRRTRSESQIDMKSIDSSSTVVPSPAPEFDVEEEVTLIKVKPMDREAPSTATPGVLRKEESLTVGKEEFKMTRGGSSASLQSSQSARTDVTDDGDEEGGGGLSRDRPQSCSRRHRLQATLQAGKKKMMDVMQKKRVYNSPIDPIEVGAEACDANLGDEKSDSGSPAHTTANGKRSPVEMKVVDKVDKKEKKKRRKYNSSAADLSRAQDSPTTSIGSIKSRTTKCTPLRENMLWGQSLHFVLDSGQNVTPPGGNRLPCKYLNITVHAKQSNSEGNNGTPEEPARPVLLGYTSLYIPQLIDDCVLTLSNCHREVFPLKPPIGLEPQLTPNSSDFSRHAGFDPRLCFGDITLGFRYFPQGFPEEACINAGDEPDASLQEQQSTERPFSPPSVKPMSHEWTPWTSKNSGGSVCAMCRGKIWLKAGSCCQRCQVVCHVKCTSKANSGIACTPQTTTVPDDSQFEVLDDELNTAMIVEDECPVSVIPNVEATTPLRGATLETVSRRMKLKNKVSEKLSLWRRKTKKDPSDPDPDTLSRVSESTTDSISMNNDPSSSSPMASIQDCLADILPQLEGSPFISGLFFQPGNAYNEQTISHAKQLGKEIFADCSGTERVAKINQQIDIIQQAIRETKDGRLAAMNNKADPSGFENLDERLQALAVVMLHYCAALQDCASSSTKSSTDSLIDAVNSCETETPSPESEIPFLLNSAGSSSSSSLKTDADILSEAMDSAIDDDTAACRSLSESTVVEDPSPSTANNQI